MKYKVINDKLFMCVYIYPVRNPKRCVETHWYRNISFQLSIQNGIQNLGCTSISLSVKVMTLVVSKEARLA